MVGYCFANCTEDIVHTIEVYADIAKQDKPYEGSRSAYHTFVGVLEDAKG